MESKPHPEESARSVIPFYLLVFFSCWKQVNHTLHGALQLKEMMQCWSRGTKEKGPLCKPSSSLCSGVRRGSIPTQGSDIELGSLNVDPFPTRRNHVLLHFCLFFILLPFPIGFINFDCNTKYGNNWFKLVWFTFSVWFGIVMNMGFALAPNLAMWPWA